MLRRAGMAAGMALAALAGAQQVPETAWRRDLEALKSRPGLARLYSLTGGEAAAPNLAGPAADLVYRPVQGAVLKTEPGRVAGLRAALLDGECFEAPAVAFASNAFSVTVWLRPLGLGSRTGNAGAANGMICSSGSGYTDGWRLAVYDWRTRQPSLDIGRDKGSFSVRAGDGLSAGFWNHLAATWDGATARLYVNGLLAAERPYAGPAAPPKGALRLGYSGYGVGSLRMAADELAVFGRALTSEEVRDLSLAGAADRAAAEQALKALEEARAAAASPAREAERCVALFERAAAPAHLRGAAAERLMRLCRQGGGGELPSRVLARLPECVEVTAEEQRLFGLALGASLAREGQADAALRIYGQLLQAADAAPLERAELRQRCAQVLRRAGRWAEARAHDEAVQADGELPAHVRDLAALAAARTWHLEGRLAEASDAFRAVGARAGLPPHLAAEAAACAAECARAAAGQPARDPESHRERLPPLPEPAVRVFVAPDGRDDAAGTLEAPFATLERARDEVRARKAGGALPPGGAAVYLRGGTYAVTNTFTLTAEDSGAVGAPVVYRAWRDERPVLDGGFRLSRFGFRKVRDRARLARLPAEARGQVYVADLRAQGYGALAPQRSIGYGIANATVRELFGDGQPLPMARWPNSGFMRIQRVVDPTNNVFACDFDRFKRWTEAREMLACGYWYHLWAGSTLPVAAVDPQARTLALAERSNYGMREERPFYVLNLLEEIDRPGEWYVDTAAGLLYLWPVRHPWFSELVLSRWDRPFIQANGVREIAFVGLTVEHGQQHGLVLDGCVNATVARCVVRRLGGTALTAQKSANLRVYGNALHTLGHTGMRVSGGNRATLASGGIVVENNEVWNFGRHARTYNPALLLEGCGARVAHNHFHRAPSSAMRIEGNDHLIEYNRVERVVGESDDQGGIDMWGNPSYRGVVIRFNHWLDIGGGDAPCGQAGIRFDDAISGMVVYGNLFERCSNGHFGGVQIHGGHLNIVDNNLFVGCRYGVSFSPWPASRWEEFLGRERTQHQLYREVNVRVPPYSSRYPELAELQRRPNVNRVWRNVFAGAEQALFRAPAGTEAWANAVLAERTDMQAAASAAAFRPLPLDEIGPYDDPLRASEHVSVGVSP